MVFIKLPAQRDGQQDDRYEWWEAAACLEVDDPELFFPVAPHGPGASEIAQAKEICGTCRVRRQCLQYALATHQAHGVWGGMTEGERQLHARREREQRHDREHAQRPHRDLSRPARPDAAGGNGRNRVGRSRSV